MVKQKKPLPIIKLDKYLIDSKIIELIPEELARKYKVVPIFQVGNNLTCAMADPTNLTALDEIHLKTNLIIEPVMADELDVKKLLDKHYGAGEKKSTLKEEKDQPEVIKLVNSIIDRAIKEGASDIHLEPEEKNLKARLRVDGMLYDIEPLSKELAPAVISRVKIMANLDIAERRVPQDGRFSINSEDKQVDVRVSTVPTMYGENVVLRLLDASSALMSLGGLGFSKQILDKYSKLIIRPHGIILVTGPTGSGKTTTLYASLDKINTAEKNIITIEDPVEYKLAGIRQIQMDEKVGLTFANGLRSILRQDPNIIMVGEIRDLETAQIAIQAALTGHLVFSTLHTNDAPSAVTRLLDMGIEPFLVSSSVIGIMAQRLVRKICQSCKEKYIPSKEDLKDIGLSENDKMIFYKGKGCSSCMNTGYKGRISLYELLLPDEKIRSAIVAKASADEIRKLAFLAGMVSLMQDGIEKIQAQITTVEEVLRVTREG